MAATLSPRGLVQIATPDELAMADRAAEEARLAAENPADEAGLTELARHIRSQWEMMRNHRNSASGWSERLLEAQRIFNGKYDAQQLAEIKQFGGSSIYSRMTAVKCRGASSLLREVYLGADKPWGLDATPEPTLPDDIAETIKGLVQTEVQTQANAGQPVDAMQVRDRIEALSEAAKRAAKKKAQTEAKQAEDKLNDYLVEGKFYTAVAEFLVDLPIFPIAIIKGPVVRIVPGIVWRDGKAVSENRARMFWNRVSPFDLYWTPGVSDIVDASVIERTRLTRADLNDLLGVPGYREDQIRLVLQEYGKGGLHDWMDPTDSERAVQELRENPTTNQSGVIDCIEFHGNVQGSMLLDWGMSESDVDDADRDYFVQAWMIGKYLIKVQINPSPRKRHPYFVTSFEKVPGTPVGNALPDILGDLQSAANATLRALINNLSISSGPQVIVNDDRIVPGADNDQLYPWKRWHVQNDPLGASQGGANAPVSFFQPNSNAQELLGIYEKFTQMADETSAIPRYITGSERLGGAGRTASGLAMLMGNASKILQTVAANIDRDIFDPCLNGLYDMAMLTDQTGLFRGDESIRVRGVDVAVQRETDRQRQIEFLQLTSNPLDAEIMGKLGRARALRAVATETNLGDDVVPSDEDIKASIEQASMQAQQQLGMPPGNPAGNTSGAAAGPLGGAGPGGGAPPPTPSSGALGASDGAAMRGMT